jgi:hypothetical protein
MEEDWVSVCVKGRATNTWMYYYIGYTILCYITLHNMEVDWVSGCVKGQATRVLSYSDIMC